MPRRQTPTAGIPHNVRRPAPPWAHRDTAHCGIPPHAPNRIHTRCGLPPDAVWLPPLSGTRLWRRNEQSWGGRDGPNRCGAAARTLGDKVKCAVSSGEKQFCIRMSSATWATAAPSLSWRASQTPMQLGMARRRRH